MVVRQDPKLIDVMNAILASLQKIGRDKDPTRWQTTPRKVRWGMVAGQINDPKPAILMELWRFTDVRMMSEGLHRITAMVNIHCLAEGDPTNAAEQLLRMTFDVIDAIVNDETLVAYKRDGLVDYSLDVEAGIGPNVDAVDRTGIGVATVPLIVIFEWEHGKP